MSSPENPEQSVQMCAIAEMAQMIIDGTDPSKIPEELPCHRQLSDSDITCRAITFLQPRELARPEETLSPIVVIRPGTAPCVEQVKAMIDSQEVGGKLLRMFFPQFYPKDEVAGPDTKHPKKNQ